MKQCMDADNLHRRLKKIIGQVQAIPSRARFQQNYMKEEKQFCAASLFLHA